MPVSTLTAPTTPETAPVTPKETTTLPIPEVWEMPTTGLQWCDCGCDCEVDEELICDYMEDVLGERTPEWVTHPELCRVIQELWNYESVCAFFFDHVDLSAKKINGSVAKRYRGTVATAIIGYFSKTWNGCPEEACEGGMDWSDVE